MTRLIFAGTPAIACPVLNALIESEYDIVAVYTQPDRPAGRGRQLTASPVKEWAQAHGLPVEQPVNFQSDQARQQLAAYQADMMIVMAYGLLLPASVLSIPRLGCVNIHVSLLPKWRGAAPIARAILAGDQQTGISLMQMDEGLDTGPVYDQHSVSIEPDDTTESLSQRLSDLSAVVLMKHLSAILQGTLKPTPQDLSQATYAKKFKKTDGQLNWSQTGDQLARQIRACMPWPTAYTFDATGCRWRILSAVSIEIDVQSAQPGALLSFDDNGVVIATGSGALSITQLQRAGAKVITAKQWIQSQAAMWSIGDVVFVNEE